MSLSATARLIAITTATLLAGCATPIARSVVEANLAQEQAANQLLLLNIARAHERMPMHFSQIGQIRAAPGGWGLGVPSLALELPFGGAAKPEYKLTAGNEGASPVDVSALNSQEFVRGITTPVTPDLIGHFASQGWPTSMLMHVFFESINALDKDGNVVERRPNNPGASDYQRFRDYVASASACGLEADVDNLKPGFLSTVLTTVSAGEAVEIGTAKQRLLPVLPDGTADASGSLPKTHFRVANVSKEAVLRLLPPPVDTAGRDECLGVIGSSAQAEQNKSSLQGAAKALAEAKRTWFPVDLARRMAANVGNGDTTVQQFVLRSPQAMLYYLGQLSRAQNSKWAGQSWPLQIRLADGSDAVLFQMHKRSDGVDADATVAVQYAGQTFAVPRGKGEGKGNGQDGGKEPQDRSMTVLALMQLILGLQDKGAEAPAASSVRLVR
jgi:hypothetical protein